LAIAVLCSAGARPKGEVRLPIPDKLVVLTFDDGNQSDLTTVTPILKRYGFGATFFVTGGLSRVRRLTWKDIKTLHEDGFEIGNHTGTHPNLILLSKEQIVAELEQIERACEEYGIPAPTTFAYPGSHTSPDVLQVLTEKGYVFSRRGVGPEFPHSDKGDLGPTYDPTEDHPLLIPTTGASGPNWDFADFVSAVEQARAGKIAVLTFHGVPDVYPHCSTEPAVFEKYMKYLHEEGFTVIALRDLAQYVDPARRPDDPYQPVYSRLGVRPMRLKCEYVVDPLGVGAVKPRFSWILESSRRDQMQAAYQVLVASSEEKLKQNIGDLWDSGKVVSSESVNVPYQGQALSSGQQCWWKVCCWNRPGNDGRLAAAPYVDGRTLREMREQRPSAYSLPATFTMGLLRKSDWQGDWIGAEKGISSPLLRKEFDLEKEVKRATVYVSGLGYYELYLNGAKVGDHVLDPATTYYNNDQPYPLGSRVLYVTHDVTSQVRKGRNAIGVMLGHGWYSAEADIPPPPSHRQPYGDRPRVILQMNLDLADGSRSSIKTDESWKATAGPITYNDYSHGETYDAGLEKSGWTGPDYDDSDWEQAKWVEPPGGELKAQMLPPSRVIKSIEPVRILKPEENVYVFDMGENFTGWARLRVRGRRGTKVRLRYGTRIHEDHTLDARSNLHPRHVARQTDTYILKGEGMELWEPRFTLHGFRYVELTGFPGVPQLENLEGRFVRSAVETNGTFVSSNPLHQPDSRKRLPDV
ncbi:family 78 glycoside hydrolase catalytic domain, partial [Acidobacteria bacterium AH-259-G07]|nr:family 78 glycoside hydrolase catalytic domain [Acidobacteria bacterium AH-259-G07]